MFEFPTTPIVESSLSLMGCRLFYKRDDLLPFSFGGNKARIAAEFYEDLKAKDCDTIIGYGSVKSNLSRAVSSLSTRLNGGGYVITSYENLEDEEEADSFNATLARLCGVRTVKCLKSNVASTVQSVMDTIRDSDCIPEIRRVDDLGELSSLIKALEGRLSPSLTARNIDIDGYAERLFSNGLAFAAYQGDKPVALIAGYANDMENCSAYISFLAVDSCAEGLNIGSRLFRMFEVEYYGQGMNEIAFEVHKVNNKAIAFYYHLGVYIDKEKDEGSWIMKKKLLGGYVSLSNVASYLLREEIAA